MFHCKTVHSFTTYRDLMVKMVKLCCAHIHLRVESCMYMYIIHCKAADNSVCTHNNITCTQYALLPKWFCICNYNIYMFRKERRETAHNSYIYKTKWLIECVTTRNGVTDILTSHYEMHFNFLIILHSNIK